jgi:hypothetical protein
MVWMSTYWKVSERAELVEGLLAAQIANSTTIFSDHGLWQNGIIQ